jgi:hypothetical protein
MAAKRRIAIPLCAFGLLIWIFVAWRLPAQQAIAPGGTGTAQPHENPLAELSPENRALFDALRDAAQKGHDADVLENGKKLLPALKPDTPLANFVTQITAGSALETGEASYALSLLKPFADTHPQEWHAATLLARLYAESDQKALRDQQIAHVIALHKQTSDADFGKLHIFPIQRVNLHSGYAMFLYPFEPLRPENSYLVALIYTREGKQDYRIELESADVDQAFFKAKKPGERRFSIDSFRKNETNANWPDSQALNGFVEGIFDYDTMRDQMVNVANGEKLPRK